MNDSAAYGATLSIFIVFFYFLPTFCAFYRNAQGKGAIAFLNFALGWTAIGWIAAFIWANVARKE